MIRLSLVLSLLLSVLSLFGQPVVYRTPVSNADISSLQTQGVSVVGLKGSHSVSHSGSAVYSVPLDLIPGIGDMIPNISLVYNSSGSNGHLGTGWSMSGLSAISVGSKDLYFDGEVLPVDISGSNPYFLDGQRLLSIEGVYGTNGAKYSLEQHDFSTIQSIGSLQGCTNCPEYFQIKTKNGRTLEYGKTNNSKDFHVNGYSVISYYLERIEDNNGNYVSYHYSIVNGEKVLSEIAYTGNSVQGTLPFNKIRFSYAQRQDKNRLYAGGLNDQAKIVLRQNLLTKVEVISGTSTVVKKYDLKYSWNENQSQLSEIVLTGALGEVTNSMLFQYGIEDIPIPSVASTHNIFSSGEKAEVFNGDFNGDGKSDILALYYSDTSSGFKRAYHTNYKIFLNNGSGGFNLSCSNTLPTDQGLGCWTYKPYIFDFLGKGKDEIILARQYDYLLGVTLLLHSFLRIDGNCQLQEISQPAFNFPISTNISNAYSLIQNNHLFVGDFTGNGYREVLTHLYKGTLMVGNSFSKVQFRGIPSINNVMDVELETPSTQNLSHYFRQANTGFTLDYDGDGKDEIALFNSDKLRMISFQLINGQLKAKLLFEFNLTAVDLSDIYVGDFNGDNKYEFLIRRTYGNNQWSILYSKGLTNHAEKFETVDLLIDESYKVLNSPLNRVIVADIDKNGLDDILVQTPIPNPPFNVYPMSNISVYFNTGTNLSLVNGRTYNIGFTKKMYSILQNFYRMNALGDFNGDGQPDLIAIAEELGFPNQPFINYRIEPDNKKLLLSATRDSYGNITRFEYSNIAKGVPLYEPMAASVPFPLMQKALPLNVVSKLLVSNANGFDEYIYRYQGLRYNHYRKQAIGFYTTYEDNLQTGYTTKTSYQLMQHSPSDFKLNIPVSVEVYKTNQPLSSPVSIEQSTFTVMPLSVNGINHPRSYWLRLDETVSKDFIQFASRKQSFLNYNNDTGLPETVNSMVYSNTNASGTPLEEVSTQTVYINVGSPAAMFMPSSITKTMKRSNTDAVTFNQAIQYDAAARVTHNISWPGTSKQQTVVYLYDAFGNRTRETISATGESDRITLFTYSSNGRFLTRKRINNVDFQGWIDFQLYDNRWAKPQRIVDVNGQITNIQYNTNWGYTVQVSDPFQNISTQSIEWTNQFQALIKTQQESPGKPSVVAYYDKQGRLVRKETLGYNNQVSYENYSFNQMGDVVEVVSTGANGVPVSTTYAYNYDLPYGRLTQATNPLGTTTYQYLYSGGGTTTNTTTNYSGWSHVETSSQTQDASGKIVRTIDQGGSLNFSFDSWGNIIRTRLDLDIIQTKKSDAYGRVEELWDINSGTMKFEYNAFGELTKQTDAKNNVTEFTYDRLGRIKTRTINGTDQTTYTYIVTGTGKGNVSQISRPTFNTSENFTYDAYGRMTSQLQSIQGQSFNFNYQYDPVTGNISQIQYPSDLTIQYQYDNKGFLSSITSATHQKSLFSDPVINHWGQYTRFTMGKGTNQFNTISSTTYNNYGQPTNIRTLNASGTPVTRFNYTFTYNEATGNMLSRRDNITGQSEIFQYDALQRLTQFQVGTSATVQQISYASDGNILSKFDAGTYAYEGVFKNAVTSVSVENSSATNPAPLAIPKHAQSIQYTPFDQPAAITENNRNLQFGYGADDMRNYSVMQTGTTQNYIRYHLGSMDREVNGRTVRDVHHIEGPSGTIAIIVKENGVWNYYHTFTDPLGSVLYVFNENGTLNARQSFDAWGRYRNPTNWNTYNTASYPRTWLYRGYTGHEMLPAFNLINMNGRLYDPITARMLSADPIINSIYNTQAYNRFSYVWNNPLKFVDPMGYDGTPPYSGGGQLVGSGSYCTCDNSFRDESSPSSPTIGFGGNGGSSGSMDAHYRLQMMNTGMAALSTHLNSFINHTNGYGSTYGLGLAGFGHNQTPVSSGGISSSSSPWDYALAQLGPAGDDTEPKGAMHAEGDLQKMRDSPPNHPEYKSPKGGDRKVKNPNGSGSGWLDHKGRVWVPTDHKGTHAPHWDRQIPGGGHENVYPFVNPTPQYVPSPETIGNALKYGTIVIGVGIIIFDIVTIPSGEGLIGVQMIRMVIGK